MHTNNSTIAQLYAQRFSSFENRFKSCISITLVQLFVLNRFRKHKIHKKCKSLKLKTTIKSFLKSSNFSHSTTTLNINNIICQIKSNSIQFNNNNFCQLKSK